MQKHHPDVLGDFDYQRKNRVSKRNLEAPPEKSAKKTKHCMTQKDFEDKINAYIIAKMLPFEAVQGEEFADLFKGKI